MKDNCQYTIPSGSKRGNIPVRFLHAHLVAPAGPLSVINFQLAVPPNSRCLILTNFQQILAASEEILIAFATQSFVVTAPPSLISTVGNEEVLRFGGAGSVNTFAGDGYIFEDDLPQTVYLSMSNQTGWITQDLTFICDGIKRFAGGFHI